MNIIIMPHDYRSASKKLERAISDFNGGKSDKAFQKLVVTLVDEACGDVQLYTPEDPDRKGPIAYRFNGAEVFALYTDPELAGACARGTVTPFVQAFPSEMSVSLAELVDRNGGTCALALEFGTPGQIILPPDVVHTLRHLMIARKFNTKEPEGSSWNEWIGIMEHYFSEREAEAEPAEAMSHRGETTLCLPVRRVERLTIPPTLPEYYIEPEADEPAAGSEEPDSPFEYSVKDGEVTITRYTGNVAEVIVPKRIDGCDVVEVGDYAFSKCQGLHSVTLPDSVQRIGAGAFSACKDLETVCLPKCIPMKNAGHELFKDCSSLRTVEVPEGIVNLGRDMFSGCINLRQVVLPTSVQGYGPGVFRGCKSLENVTLPSGAGMIAGSSFEDSALSPYVEDIKGCMSSHQAFVLKDGKNMTTEAPKRTMTPEQEDAVAPEYALGEGFILENEKRLLQRQSFDPAKGRHVFRDVMFGGEITVVELKPKSALAQRMDDKSLAVFLLGVDATLGLPVGRAPEGEIKEYNGIFYGTCVLPNNGGKLSIAVCNGHALAISGSIASIIIHLKPAARGDRKESAPGPTTTTGSASARTEQKPSLLRRLKDLLGK